MSRGPGRIERAIEAIFIAEPDSAFTTDELFARVYPKTKIPRHWQERKPVRRKLAVAVIRAARNVMSRVPDWQASYSWTRGRRLVFFNHGSLRSYAMAREKTSYFPGSDEQIRANLAPGGWRHDQVAEGGAYWLAVQLYIADRDGDRSRRANNLRKKKNAIRAGYGMAPAYPDLAPPA